MDFRVLGPGRGRLTFASGDVEGVVHVAVRGDRVVEPDEALSVGLSDPSNATLGDASAPLTIEDHEPLALAVTSPSVSEGNSGTTPATFTVALDGAAPAGSSVSVDYHVAGVTATVPGDVAPASGTLTFAAGVELGLLSDRRAGRYTWLERGKASQGLPPRRLAVLPKPVMKLVAFVPRRKAVHVREGQFSDMSAAAITSAHAMLDAQRRWILETPIARHRRSSAARWVAVIGTHRDGILTT